MNISFRTELREVDESYPDGLTPEEVALYISRKKALAFDGQLTDEVLITADTIVSVAGKILGKPGGEQEAIEMLQLLSGRMHEVITGVCLLKNGETRCFAETTEVYFRELSNEQIRYYIQNFKPFDKAGSYGIQEWIGFVGVEKIVGSYTNVMGLPTQRLYAELLAMIE